MFPIIAFKFSRKLVESIRSSNSVDHFSVCDIIWWIGCFEGNLHDNVCKHSWHNCIAPTVDSHRFLISRRFTFRFFATRTSSRLIRASNHRLYVQRCILLIEELIKWQNFLRACNMLALTSGEKLYLPIQDKSLKILYSLEKLLDKAFKDVPWCFIIDLFFCFLIHITKLLTCFYQNIRWSLSRCRLIAGVNVDMLHLLLNYFSILFSICK